MNCRLPLLPPLPQLLVSPPPQPPSLKVLWGETKRQTHKSGAGRGPTSRGATQQRWRQGRDREDGGDVSPQLTAGCRPPCCFSTWPCTQRAGWEPSSCWPVSSLLLGAPVGSRAGPWWPGQGWSPWVLGSSQSVFLAEPGCRWWGMGGGRLGAASCVIRRHSPQPAPGGR